MTANLTHTRPLGDGTTLIYLDDGSVWHHSLLGTHQLAVADFGAAAAGAVVGS